MKLTYLPTLLLSLRAIPSTTALRIATSLSWIEHTPQPYAIRNFYKGTSTATLISGGVANLPRDTSVDLAANAATQGLKQYSNNRNLRLIYIICEVPYRLIARRDAGVRTPSDLKGKKIGTIRGSSAQSFVELFLSGVGGLKSSDYTMANGNVCMRSPCGSGTFPAQLRSKQIDAFGVWEPAVELAAQDLKDQAAIFQNGSVYREVYSLYTTTQKLANAATRKDIVEFVRALNKTLDVFAHNPPESVYTGVASAVGMDVAIVKDVWKDHLWTGRWGPDLVDFLMEEDKLLQRLDNRRGIPREDLEKFLDTSIINEL